MIREWWKELPFFQSVDPEKHRILVITKLETKILQNDEWSFQPYWGFLYLLDNLTSAWCRWWWCLWWCLLRLFRFLWCRLLGLLPMVATDARLVSRLESSASEIQAFCTILKLSFSCKCVLLRSIRSNEQDWSGNKLNPELVDWDNKWGLKICSNSVSDENKNDK